MAGSAHRRGRIAGTLAAVLAASAVIPLAAASAGRQHRWRRYGRCWSRAAAAGAAPGGPGAMSYFDLARKDCVGTARNTTSKVWYTVADGVLSDTYEPTIDNTNVSTLQYVVTDGSTLHRPADPGHDLHGRAPTRPGWPAP